MAGKQLAVNPVALCGLVFLNEFEPPLVLYKPNIPKNEAGK